MAFSLNEVRLLGNLGFDPEKGAKDNSPVRLRIATSRSWKDKNTNEWKEATTWHTVNVWGASGDYAMNHLKKGDSVYVEGEINNNEVTDDNGNKRTFTDVKASRLQLANRKNGNGNGNGASSGVAPSAGAPASSSSGSSFKEPF